MSFLILDGNSILNRTFYGVKALTTKDGRYTNAIFGFLNIFFRLQELTNATHAAAAFDLKAPTFRHEMYPDYKSGRKHMPEELAQQLPVIKELLPLLGVTVVTKEGFEADDILGTLSAVADKEGMPCFLATGDRDSLQLVSSNTTVLLASTKMGQPDTAQMDEAAILDKYGIPVSALIDLKALMGDASDKIPGVAGVGEKTAVSLLQQFGSLDALYASLDTADIRESLRQKLLCGKDDAYLSRTLGTICRDVPIDTDLTTYRMGERRDEELSQMLTSLEFFKMLDKLGLSACVSTDTCEKAAVMCELGALDEVLKKDGVLNVVPTADGRVFVCRDGEGAYVDSLDDILPLLSAEDIVIRTHDGKTLYKYLLENGITPRSFVGMDTLLAAYLLDPLTSDYSLPRLLISYGICGETDTPERYFEALCDRLQEELAADEEQYRVLTDIELPLSLVLASMETIGVAVDRDGIVTYGEALEQEITRLQRGVWDEVGYEFNLNSPKQLAVALFEDLALPHGKKTKTGWSTNAEVLEKLRHVHPAVDMLLQYRTLAKLKSTYCDGLAACVDTDGRIRSTFNQAETRTGRISSSDPNLQNIPVRQPQGRELRRFFKAKDGHVLIDADYSQIELRVLACLGEDPVMLDAFRGDVDIHTATASQVFGLPTELVTPILRSRAKAVNFGVVYGIGAHSLSEDIGVSYKEAKAYIENYLKGYGAVAAYLERLITDAKACGYAKTAFGRRRPLPELSAGNAITRGFGERVARNMPIQGTAADIIKLAMIRVFDRLQRENRQARLILQVHDELIVEAPVEEADAVAALLREEMERTVSWAIPLTADVHVGETWFDAKE